MWNLRFFTLSLPLTAFESIENLFFSICMNRYYYIQIPSRHLPRKILNWIPNWRVSVSLSMRLCTLRIGIHFLKDPGCLQQTRKSVSSWGLPGSNGVAGWPKHSWGKGPPVIMARPPDQSRSTWGPFVICKEHLFLGRQIAESTSHRFALTRSKESITKRIRSPIFV
jgi:hypothetical protein